MVRRMRRRARKPRLSSRRPSSKIDWKSLTVKRLLVLDTVTSKIAVKTDNFRVYCSICKIKIKELTGLLAV